MRDSDPALRAAVVAWPTTGDPQPDWEDVLRRAGVRSPGTRSTGPRRAALVAGLAIGAVLLTLPGLGIDERLKDLVSGSKRPGLGLGATLRRPDGTPAGSFSIRTSRIFLTLGRHRHPVGHVFVPRSLKVPKGIAARWRLELTGSDEATNVQIVRTGVAGVTRVVAVVCNPCSGRTSGSVRLTRSGFGALLDGRTSVSVATPHGHLTGRIRLGLPRRR